MVAPPLLKLPDEAAYRAHFESVYCRGPVITFDGIRVRIRKRDFDHCCFKTERGTRRKTIFCRIRAERIDWIKAALEDPAADLRVGWDNLRKQYAHDRRVAIVFGTYVVVIEIQRCGTKAELITTYVADSGPGNTLNKLKKAPKWRQKRT
ncbi:MAG: hypothetical protein JJU00_05075 [Opitutales bacterium]|nr:hypothetical protein [Opitutales bacterium]